MILCLDAGNSRLKWGLYEHSHWHAQGVLGHAEIGSLGNRLTARPTQMIACNVAGPSVRDQLAGLAADLKIPLRWLISSPTACGVTNRYDHPAQLGADRWAALIGARALHPGPSLVVMAGTATTIDQLDAEGVFRGGLILPGLELMRTALAGNTANLPLAAGLYQNTPRNTDDAIVSGSLHATLGAIQRMRDALDPRTSVLLSGGAAEPLAGHIDEPVLRVENLVLEGLARYADYPPLENS